MWGHTVTGSNSPPGSLSPLRAFPLEMPDGMLSVGSFSHVKNVFWSHLRALRIDSRGLLHAHHLLYHRAMASSPCQMLPWQGMGGGNANLRLANGESNAFDPLVNGKR